MPKMQHWLVVWGTGVTQIRSAQGYDTKSACQYAFGMYSDNMTALPLTLYELRTQKHRKVKIKALLTNHRQRYSTPGRIRWLDEDEKAAALAKIDKELATL